MPERNVWPTPVRTPWGIQNTWWVYPPRFPRAKEQEWATLVALPSPSHNDYSLAPTRPPKERKPCLHTNKLGRGGCIPKIAAIDSWYWRSLFLAFDPATVSTSDTMDTAVWLHRPNMITLPPPPSMKKRTLPPDSPTLRGILVWAGFGQ